MRIAHRVLHLASLFAAFIVGITFSSFLAYAWTGPTASAPDNNVSAPINVSTIAQVKNGDLGVNNISILGNTLFSGLGVGTGRYLNFDYTSGGTSGTGSSGYGIRDNAGTLEFKNQGGLWRSLASSTEAYLSIGAVTQIKFADGTTQTTAGGGGSSGNIQTFLSSGTWTKPSSGSIAMVECWGGGGGGGKRSGNGVVGGGGGGGYNLKWLQLASLPATVPVTVGAGGYWFDERLGYRRHWRHF